MIDLKKADHYKLVVLPVNPIYSCTGEFISTQDGVVSIPGGFVSDYSPCEFILN